ncbi:protein FMC1 homolog [Nerophis lumbriciformis]|uniref:protein FMC1 homolog n=1 Tax=Nerophis lumbriciformis TaxID=546530 RepID=UPI002ADF6246|nr:protein FMC1 homolog [Nerophis lumbriciformis]
MASSSSLRVYSRILKELRSIQGHHYKQSLACTYVKEQFRKNKVTGERYCRAQQEALHASQTYLCLLASTRNHQALHELYHGKGERSPREVAGLVGLRLPTQPGGKGWEK